LADARVAARDTGVDEGSDRRLDDQTRIDADGGAAVVEWGERLREPGAVRIVIEVLDERRRRLRIDPPGEEAPNRWSW